METSQPAAPPPIPPTPPIPPWKPSRTAARVWRVIFWLTLGLGALLGLAAIALIFGGGYCPGLILGVFAFFLVPASANGIITLNARLKEIEKESKP